MRNNTAQEIVDTSIRNRRKGILLHLIHRRGTVGFDTDNHIRARGIRVIVIVIGFEPVVAITTLAPVVMDEIGLIAGRIGRFIAIQHKSMTRIQARTTCSR